VFSRSYICLFRRRYDRQLDLYSAIRYNDIDKSTIYRILDLFLKENIIKVEIINNEKNYIINNNEHVHYINCIKCHKKEKIDVCPLKEIKDFKIVSHNISIDGICKDCQ
jgi:Fur family ferric uptake transcriptional regulator